MTASDERRGGSRGQWREMVSSKGLRGLIGGAEAARRFRSPHQGHQGAGLKKARAGAKRTSRPARRPPVSGLTQSTCTLSP